MHYRSQSEDTTPEAERIQIEIWRRMTVAEKLHAWAELQAAAEQIAEAGIRRRHPGASAREVFLRKASLRLDRETMIAVFGWDPEAAQA